MVSISYHFKICSTQPPFRQEHLTIEYWIIITILLFEMFRLNFECDFHVFAVFFFFWNEWNCFCKWSRNSLVIMAFSWFHSFYILENGKRWIYKNENPVHHSKQLKLCWLRFVQYVRFLIFLRFAFGCFYRGKYLWYFYDI